VRARRNADQQGTDDSRAAGQRGSQKRQHSFLAADDAAQRPRPPWSTVCGRAAAHVCVGMDAQSMPLCEAPHDCHAITAMTACGRGNQVLPAASQCRCAARTGHCVLRAGICGRCVSVVVEGQKGAACTARRRRHGGDAGPAPA
jgi:hypothetical protein